MSTKTTIAAMDMAERAFAELNRLRADNARLLASTGYDVAEACFKGEMAALRAENTQLTASNKWLVNRLRDAVNVCYGGTTHDAIDAHDPPAKATP